MNKDKLLVIRHLKTADNLTNCFCSGDRDIPIFLSENIVFGNLVDVIGDQEEIFLLAHTGLIRTRQTALMIQKLLGYLGEILILPEFRERIGGVLAGMDFENIKNIFPDIEKPCDLWRVESLRLGLERVTDFLFRIEKGLEQLQKIQSNILLVAHAGTIKGIRAVVEAKTHSERIKILCSETPKNAECYEFRL